MLLDKKSNIILSIERASNDLRKGFPVIITGDLGQILVMSPETVLPTIIPTALKTGKTQLIITGNRAKLLSDNKVAEDSAITIATDNINQIAELCGLEAKTTITDNKTLKSCNNIQKTALKLAKIAELIPSVITAQLPDSFKDDNILSVSEEYIKQYSNLISYEITEACRTKIALRQSIESEIIAYRPNIGGKEHYAILVGKKNNKNPLVRIHSSCYTGDLLDSLACDCHDQLHSAIEIMDKNGGGIILYMLQEGRGIGLINKLRAYALKETGLDTVDANEALGFGEDERLFTPAAEILKELGVKQVRLLTNNPRKASGLEEYGINVSECVPHIMQSNIHNENYLKTKSSRLGHKMGSED